MSSAMVVNGKLARYPDPPQIYHTDRHERNRGSAV